jgi:hypothetical protein
LTSYMALHGDEKMRGMAQRAQLAIAIFADDKLPLPSEAQTMVLPPAKD